jgi:hypothetical protein
MEEGVMKLYVVLVGLISLVPNDNGITALVPKAPNHHPDVALGLRAQVPSTVISLGSADPTDARLASSAAAAAVSPVWGNYPGQAGNDRFIEFSRILGSEDAARVDDDCLAAQPASSCKGKLSGRIFVEGPVEVLPINFTIPSSLKLLPSDKPWSRLYGFVDEVTKRELDYRGNFSGAVFLSLEVADTATHALEVGGARVTIQRSEPSECAKYATVAEVSPTKPCFLVMVGNVPYSLSGPAQAVMTDHFSLLTDLLETPTAIRPAMTWINQQLTQGDGFGTGMHTACPGGRMMPPRK